MFKSRNLFSGLHLTALLAIVFLIVLFAYLVLKHHRLRYDLTRGSVYSLSEGTVELLKRLKAKPITITAFFKDQGPARARLENLLVEYAYYHGNFHYRFFDPDRHPAKAKEYKVTDYETVVVELSGKREATRRVSEEALTNLIFKLDRGIRRKVVFDTGHGGPALARANDNTSFAFLKQRLEESNYETSATVLLTSGIPEGADVFILGGPRVDMLPEELEVIQEFLDSGGAMLLLMDPVEQGEGKNLTEFLRQFGIWLGTDVIVDKASKLYGTDYLVPLVTDYRLHAITYGFEIASFYPLARSVAKVDEVPVNVQAAELAWTNEGSWAETALDELEKGRAEFDATSDRKGPVPLAVAAFNHDTGARVVVFGDSDFATDQYAALSGNKDMVLNAVSWLARDEAMIHVRPRIRESTPLFLKESHQRFLVAVPVFGLPALSLAAGSGVFLWRRRYQ